MTKEEQWKREAEIKLNELDSRGFDFDSWSISDAYERGYCDCADAKEKQIAELKNRNQELLESCEGATMMYKDLQKANNNLTKAKELLKRYVKIYVNPYPEEEIELRDEAEQFLKDSEGE